MKKKTFLTLFPYCENVHLIKDVGMLPYFMYKCCDYDAYLASFDTDFVYAQKEVKGLKLLKIDKVFKNPVWNCCWFMWKHAREFDVLQLYHEGHHENIFASEIYRLRNPRGVVYIKLDADIHLLDRFNFWRKGVRGYVYRRHLRKAGLITAETKEAVRALSENWQLKVDYIPNGFYSTEDSKALIDYSVKENCICTVGRLGSYPKNTEELLQGFVKFAPRNPDWKLWLVGPMEESFSIYLEKLLENNPEIAERIITFGMVTDREKLNDIYARSKIFCLTSEWENFALVYLEALSNGCYIVTSNVGAYMDVIDTDKYGSWYRSGHAEELASELEKACRDEARLKRVCESAPEHAYTNFYWPKIVEQVDFLLSHR